MPSRVRVVSAHLVGRLERLAVMFGFRTASPTMACSTSAAVTTPSKLPYSSITSASPSVSPFRRSSASSALIVSGTIIGWRRAGR